MIIEIEGLKLEIADRLPNEGELYVAERNTGKKLLTAKRIDYTNNYVIPVERNAYVYDFHECKAVVKMLD